MRKEKLRSSSKNCKGLTKQALMTLYMQVRSATAPLLLQGEFMIPSSEEKPLAKWTALGEFSRER